jgi:hypothetical protein
MVQERANLDYGRDDDLGNDRTATDASEMTEGVGGITDLDEDERATVGDVDGDNVRDDKEINPEASTYGSP